MSVPPIEAVIAGSRAFALSLLAPLAERTGSRPRVAASPAQALGLCGPGGVVVVEFQGEDSLSGIQDLVFQGGDLRVLAAVASAHAAAIPPLQALGVEVVPWEGKADSVLQAVTAGPAPARRPAAVPQAAAARPATTPVKPPGAVAPPGAAARPATTPTKPPGAVAPPGAAARPATTPTKPPGAVAPPGAAARPATTPTKPPGAVAPPGVSPRPATTPVKPAPAIVPPPPAPEPLASAAPSTPFDGILADMRAKAGAAPAAQGPRPGPGPGLFDEIADDPFAAGSGDFDVAIDALDAPAAPAPLLTPVARMAPASRTPTSARPPWPSDVPGPTEAAEALGRALGGEVAPPGDPFQFVAEVVAGLTELERAVLAGKPRGIDGEPIRRAAVMRVRVAAALAAAPAARGEVDAAAVSSFLAEIDALLSEVNALSAGAPAEVQPSLEAVRNVLVKEAIDFSEAAQRSSAGGAVAAAVPAALARARVGRTKVLSEKEAEAPADRRQRKIVLALVLAVAAAAAFHGWRIHTRTREIPPRPSLPLAPAGSIATGAKDGQVVVKPGAPMDPEALRAFRERESLKGNEVTEVAPGVVVVKPAAPEAGGK